MNWLDQARELFEAAYGACDGDLAVVIMFGARKLRLSIPKKGEPRGSEIEVAILKAAAQLTAPVSSKQLARLAGYRHNSYFLQAVTRLVRSGQLRRTADGIA